MMFLKFTVELSSGETMDLIGLYKKMILSLIPKNLEKQLKTEKGTLGDGIKNVLLASLVVDVVLLVAMLLQFLLIGSMAGMAGDYGDMAALGGGFGITTVIMLVLVPVIMVVTSLISTALAFVLCKILGGKGTFADQYFQFSILGSGATILGFILNIIPIAGSILASLLGLYYLYPVFMVYRGVHKFSNMKAALAVIIPIVLGAILAVLLMGYFIASLGSMMPSRGYY